MKEIYLDNAAATPIDSRVKKEVRRGMGLYGNPSSYNNAGRRAAKELSIARTKTACFLGARSEEIIFTASGSEANNLAIQGIARNFQFSILPTPPKQLRLRRPGNFQTNSEFQKSKPHIITTKIEHPSVLEPIRYLETEGFDVTYLPVNKEGFINLEEFKNALRPETVLVSVMYANNEIGTIEPIIKIGKILNDFKIKNLKFKIHEKAYPLFHVDACQAAGYLDLNVNQLGVNLLTFNGSKIGGPRGAGVLYARRGTALAPFVLGGGQERGLRAGTENLPAILGLTKAVELIDGKEGARLIRLRDYFFNKIREIIPNVRINGPAFAKALAIGSTKSAFDQAQSAGKPEEVNRLPNNINVSVSGIDSENLLLELDKYGIRAGSGSACTSRSVEPSHVLKAIGVEKKYLSGAIRFSMGKQTTKKDLDYVLKVLPGIISDLKKRYRHTRN